MRDHPQTMAMQQLQGSGAGRVSDLVKRLRAWHTPNETITGDVQLYLDAAARIKALEKALRDIVEAGDFWEMDSIARKALAPEQDK